MTLNDPKSTHNQDSEAAIRHIISTVQEGFRQKNGALFASVFAPVHDFVTVAGALVPNLTREANAQIHQELFDGSRKGALGNDLSKIEPPSFEVRSLRFLTPEVAFAHIMGEVGGKAEVMASAVLQRREGEWLIVSFHNAPILNKPV